MDNERLVTKIYKWKSLGTQMADGPTHKWEDNVMKDLLKIKNWIDMKGEELLRRSKHSKNEVAPFEEEESKLLYAGIFIAPYLLIFILHHD
jgi:hypothetical protein